MGVRCKRGNSVDFNPSKTLEGELVYPTYPDGSHKLWVGNGDGSVQHILNLTEFQQQLSTIGNASPKGVYSSLSALQTALPSGPSDKGIYIVAGTDGTREVDNLEITGAPTASGNIAVYLNGISHEIAVTAGIAEVASLNITAAPTTAGNTSVVLNGISKTVAVDTGMITADAIAAAIRGTSFDGWTTGGAGSTITFTANAAGTKADAAFSGGSTGVTGTMSTTMQGENADTKETIAAKIRGESYEGWAAGGSGTTVIFSKSTIGTNTPIAFNAGNTGITASVSITTPGEASRTSDWYYWNGTTWIDGGIYQGVGIADGSITPEWRSQEPCRV